MTARIPQFSIIATALACLLVAIAPAWADSNRTLPHNKPPAETPQAEPLGELDRELFGPAGDAAQPADSPAPGRGAAARESDEWKKQLLKELGAAATPEEQNPLLEIARQMREVEALIAQSESGPPTQDLQRRIVASLDELIRQAQSRCQQGSPSQGSPKSAPRQQVAQPKPEPAQAKTAPKPDAKPTGTAGRSQPKGLTPGQMRDLVKAVWGELPETERQRIQQWAGDEFLPKYEWLIELYFKRLAEQRGPGGG